MPPPLALVVGLLAAAAHAALPNRACGAPGSRQGGRIKEETAAAAGRFADRLCTAATAAHLCSVDRPRYQAVCALCEPAPPTEVFTVDLAFHVVYDGASMAGWVSEEQVRAQVDVLNTDFGGRANHTGGAAITPFQFRLSHIDYTANGRWFRDIGVFERVLRPELAFDPSRVLDIWTGDFQWYDLFGYAYLPWAFAPDSPMHGVSILWSTLPGGPFELWSLGRTCTHEVGHALGLWHPWDSGCNGIDDLVDDTPPERLPIYGCPERRPDTCPGKPGKASTENFMSYVDDPCMNEFTPGQSAFMLRQVLFFRPQLLLSEDARDDINALVPGLWDGRAAIAAPKDHRQLPQPM